MTIVAPLLFPMIQYLWVDLTMAWVKSQPWAKRLMPKHVWIPESLLVLCIESFKNYKNGINIFLLFIDTIDYSQCGVTQGCFIEPPNCNSGNDFSNCAAAASFKHVIADNDYIEYQLLTNTLRSFGDDQPGPDAQNGVYVALAQSQDTDMVQLNACIERTRGGGIEERIYPH